MVHPATSHEKDAVQMVCRKVEQSISVPIHINDLAREAGMNLHRLTDLFHYFTGHSIEEYHILLRMSLAVRLLTETDDSITDIAYTVGYSNVRSFGKEFKKHAHYTATQYRQLYRNKKSG